MSSTVKRFNFEGSNVMTKRTVTRFGSEERTWQLLLGIPTPGRLLTIMSIQTIRRELAISKESRFATLLVSTLLVSISEPGVYALVFSSNLPSVKTFQRWVFSTVLPSIRRIGQYNLPMPVGNNVMLTNETDLHYRNLTYLKRFHPNAIVVPGLQGSSTRPNPR